MRKYKCPLFIVKIVLRRNNYNCEGLLTCAHIFASDCITEECM